MQARGPLMAEHRVIEKVIYSFKKKMEIMRETKKADIDFIRDTIDFIRVYTDKMHHGKEEDILFKKLANKSIEEEDRAAMKELIREHRWAWKKVKSLGESVEKYAGGDKNSINDIIETIEKLVKFYPRHIEKEDGGFFPAFRKYLSRQEEDEMLKDFTEFDSRMIHEKYRAVEKSLSERV